MSPMPFAVPAGIRIGTVSNVHTMPAPIAAPSDARMSSSPSDGGVLVCDWNAVPRIDTPDAGSPIYPSVSPDPCVPAESSRLTDTAHAVVDVLNTPISTTRRFTFAIAYSDAPGSVDVGAFVVRLETENLPTYHSSRFRVVRFAVHCVRW